jgi:hypothetical protein
MIGFDSDLARMDIVQTAGKRASRIGLLPFMPQQHLAEQLSACGVFVMPSIYESHSNGWIDAMSYGLAAIGSTSSCGPEIVADVRQDSSPIFRIPARSLAT